MTEDYRRGLEDERKAVLDYIRDAVMNLAGDPRIPPGHAVPIVEAVGVLYETIFTGAHRLPSEDP